VKRNPLSFRNRLWYLTKGCVWFTVWGFPLGGVGCALCVFIVTIPVGMFFIWLAALPLANMVQRRGEEVNKWKKSPVPGLTDKDLPWANVTMADEPWNER
jgi:hypothetical protein